MRDGLDQLYVVVIVNHKIISLFLRNYNFATVTNSNANIGYARYLICDPWEVVTPG